MACEHQDVLVTYTVENHGKMNGNVFVYDKLMMPNQGENEYRCLDCNTDITHLVESEEGE